MHRLCSSALRLNQRLLHAGRMALSEKPYVYQGTMMHRELQAVLEREFNMVQPENLEKFRDKISAIFVFLIPKITAELVAGFPNLKVIGSCAVGYDSLDMKACVARGIRVGYTPDVLSDTTADMGWALLLAVARRVVEGDRITKSPETRKIDPNWLGFQVSGTTIGIIGMGRIGLEVAKRAVGFNMKVLYHNRNRRPQEEEELVKATYVSSLPEMLGQSDYVVMVTPGGQGTYQMMGQDQFGAMKKTGIFVNISRGTTVDQDALVEALKSGTIAAAGLDVTAPEPLPRDHPLLTFPNVVITPHTGSQTLHTRMRMVQRTIDNIWAALRGEPMPSEVKL